jgi:hypothetical protein
MSFRMARRGKSSRSLVALLRRLPHYFKSERLKRGLIVNLCFRRDGPKKTLTKFRRGHIVRAPNNMPGGHAEDKHHKL